MLKITRFVIVTNQNVIKMWGNLLTFSKRRGELDRTSIFRGDCKKKRGWPFPGGAAIFTQKNKPKSEIFNDKKGL